MNTPTFLATYAPQYVRTVLTDGQGPIEPHARTIADTIGINPWDVDLNNLMAEAARKERPPVSRFGNLGGPCRYIRAVDVFFHILLPEMMAERFPRAAAYLRATSPRWGRGWRGWVDNTPLDIQTPV
jgi:hypothetical protein